MDKTSYVILAILCSFVVHRGYGQILSIKEMQVDSVIMHHIGQRQIIPSNSMLYDTRWVGKDGMGSKTIFFSSNNRYKVRFKGAMGKYGTEKGKWYIYDKYVVLKVKKDKVPLYPMKYGGKTVLLDQGSIDIMRQLIMGFIVRDKWIGELTESDVFGFLDGFEKI